MTSSFYAIIPAGGAGTRLWPLSRATRPKFLLDLDGSGRSLLQRTWDRLIEVTDPSRIFVVTGQDHADAVRAQLPELGDDRVLAEPAPRDSMPAIGWAASVIARLDPDAIIGSFAADQIIDDSPAFAEAVRQARIAAEADYVCTIGVSPSGPSTAFGYIESGDNLGLAPAPEARAVVRFAEKPDATTAAAFLATGRHSWNAGMFVSKASVLIGHLRRLHPDLAASLESWADEPERLDATWARLPAIAIDHAIAEPVAAEGGIATVPATFAWNDIGDFGALADLSSGANVESVVLDGSAFISSTTGRPVTVIGLEDAIVVDTGDALLVTTRAHAQRVKQATEAWREKGRADLL